ncbi:MAG: BolA family transcriptional regulator [Gammaproteobacteria bacterium]|nr:BolA family transcriptional regulator [Gammaproteobacteria bacterium]
MNAEQITAMIYNEMPDATVEVKSPDDTHFEAVVISPDFEGLRSLQRHQKVYAALGEYMGREIHALALKTYTPQEWEAVQTNAL